MCKTQNRGARKGAELSGLCSVKEPLQRTQMKGFGFYYFLTVTLIVLALYGKAAYNCVTAESVPQASEYANHPTKEQRASHMVQFYSKNGRELSQCSSTAIGPHAFLTAEHCDERHEAKQVSFDLATEKHNLVVVTSDNRDHVIYLVDGTAFSNVVDVDQVPARIGEDAVLYGDGDGMYPPLPKFGTVANCYDPSDIDAASGIICFSTTIIPGDSGAAVYNSKGGILGLLTYGAPDDTSVGFALNFSAAQIAGAKNFDGKAEASEDDINTMIQQMLGVQSPKK